MARDEHICEICGKNTESRDRWMHSIRIPGVEDGWNASQKKYIYGDKIACDACWDAHCRATKGKNARELDEVETAKIKAQNARLGRHVGDEVYDRHYKGE